MKTYRTILCSIAAILFTATTLNCNAVIIYDFYGTCSQGCTLAARGTLVLNDSYVAGTEVTASDYVAWDFAILEGSYSLNDPRLTGMSTMLGSLPVYSGRADFLLDFGGESYFSTGEPFRVGDPDRIPTGSWSNLGPEPRACTIDHCYGVEDLSSWGSHHLWIRRVPEPTTLALLLGSLVLLRLIGSTQNRLFDCHQNN